VWSQPPATNPPVTESRYAANLEYFIETLRKRNCKVIIMTPNPMRWTPTLKNMYGKPPYRPFDPDGFNVTLRPYADGVRAVAKKRIVPLVDVYAAFQEYGKDKSLSIDDLLLDGMHPNDKGHRLVADLLIKEILTPIVDLSAVKSPQELDVYIGKRIALTGVYHEGKTCYVSLGDTKIEVFPENAHPGDAIKVTGVLRKCGPMPKGRSDLQAPSVSYWLEQ
jgi:hypothetical protein